MPDDRDVCSIRSFGCHIAQLQEMAQGLRSCEIETIAMETTGVCWVPVFEILESYGFEVLVVDARQIKNLSQRTSDVLDCQWICHLLRVKLGLV